MNIEGAFRNAFTVLFGECNLELDELAGYLSKWHYSVVKRKSALSGKAVALSSDRYCEGARFISQDEAAYGKKYALGINEIKDIDSIIGALGDRFYYTGNKAFGKSEGIESSDGCFDSFHVRDSLNIQASKYVAYSSYVRGGSELAFGSSYLLDSKCSIRLHAGAHCSRCFESYHIHNSSDLFFAYNCHGCSHAMFSFNLRSKRHAIGNVELPKEKYFALRKKLVGESREYLEKHRDFPSIFAYSGAAKGLPKLAPAPSKDGLDLGKIEEPFKSTCRVVFGAEIGAMDEYAGYLNEGNPPIEKVKTAFGGTAYPAKTFFYHMVPPSRVVTNREADEAGKLHVEIGGQEGLGEMLEKLGKIAFYVSEWDEGENRNNIESPISLSATNTYRSNASYSKNVGYTVMAQNSESVFGSFRLLHSKFCIRCYHSANIARCFEVSDSSSCTDCYFCHNCENLDSCMFCFNAKSLRYAIGNVEVGKGRYMEIRKLVLGEIVKRLKNGRNLPFGIYSIGCK